MIPNEIIVAAAGIFILSLLFQIAGWYGFLAMGIVLGILIYTRKI